MRTHPIIRRSVEKAPASHSRGGNENSIPTFLRGQDSKASQPAQFLAIEECRSLNRRGLGEFINRGRAFRRFDVASVQGDGGEVYEASGRGGESQHVQERRPMGPREIDLPPTIMDRFVSGERTAVAAVNGWIDARKFPMVMRWDRFGRKGQRCRIVAKGKVTDAVMVQFHDGFEAVTTRNAVVLAEKGHVSAPRVVKQARGVQFDGRD